VTEQLFRETNERPLQVSELIELLREALDQEFGDVWVEGEIGSLHRSRPGHLYFDLKDPDGQLRSVMFRSAAVRLPLDPEEGMQVRVHGKVDVYADRGTLQLVVDHLEPHGEGALRIAFERLKARLHEEGLFDPAHKRPLPFFPRRVGLVTSRHGAALHDLVRGLRRRGAPIELVLYDARVQGEGAWREVVRGLHLLGADPSIEVIVIARGGGSIEDLWNFNREEVVRAVFESETPVVSAIGHEVDVVLTDLVADARASTPTAAAELVVPDAEEIGRRLDGLARRLVGREKLRVSELRARVEALRRAVRHPGERLADIGERLMRARERLAAAVVRVHERGSVRSTHLCDRLFAEARRRTERERGRIGRFGASLEALSPLGVLGRGYSITRRERDGAIVKGSREVGEGEGILVQLSRGALRANVRERLEES
jgi:exodeoxyribonuclease VII large subunit